MDKIKILLAEDDLDFGNILVQYLGLNNYEVFHGINGTEAWSLFKNNKVDLCLLDIMMPEMDGFTLAEKIVKGNSDVPIVFLTARGIKEDKIKGLKLGVDYITKPFDPDELILRMQNILSRYKLVLDSELCIASTVLNCDTLVLESGGKKQILTFKEMELLRFLMQNHNKTISREELLTNVWGEDDYFLGRSMDVFISKIRKYLSPDKQIAIRTVRGKGFILEKHIA